MDPATLDLVKVEFDYVAENADELNLKKGQFVIVTKRDDQVRQLRHHFCSNSHGVLYHPACVV